jgi:cytochrome c peroxidase
MSSTLDPLLQKGNRIGVALTIQQKRYIIAFLKTLTDYSLINNPEFSNPYR